MCHHSEELLVYQCINLVFPYTYTKHSNVWRKSTKRNVHNAEGIAREMQGMTLGNGLVLVLEAPFTLGGLSRNRQGGAIVMFHE